jgi:hypothetical protein
MQQSKSRKKKKAKLSKSLFILKEIQQERERQNAKWGEQNHPIGSDKSYSYLADFFRARCDKAFKDGIGTYFDILLEEVAEAAAEIDADATRIELIQVAAVVVAMIEKIDRGGL